MTPWLDEARHLLRLAQRDYRTFRILVDSGQADLAPTCFHAQQSAEKALKAVLTLRRRDFSRTHNLSELVLLVADAGLAPPLGPDDYLRLTPFAVALRYDEQVTDLLTSGDADRIARPTLQWAQSIVSAGIGA